MFGDISFNRKYIDSNFQPLIFRGHSFIFFWGGNWGVKLPKMHETLVNKGIFTISTGERWISEPSAVSNQF